MSLSEDCLQQLDQLAGLFLSSQEHVQKYQYAIDLAHHLRYFRSALSATQSDADVQLLIQEFAGRLRQTSMNLEGEPAFQNALITWADQLETDQLENNVSTYCLADVTEELLQNLASYSRYCANFVSLAQQVGAISSQTSRIPPLPKPLTSKHAKNTEKQREYHRKREARDTAVRAAQQAMNSFCDKAIRSLQQMLPIAQRTCQVTATEMLSQLIQTAYYSACDAASITPSYEVLDHYYATAVEFYNFQQVIAACNTTGLTAEHIRKIVASRAPADFKIEASLATITTKTKKTVTAANSQSAAFHPSPDAHAAERKRGDERNLPTALTRLIEEEQRVVAFIDSGCRLAHTLVESHEVFVADYTRKYNAETTKPDIVKLVITQLDLSQWRAASQATLQSSELPAHLKISFLTAYYQRDQNLLKHLLALRVAQQFAANEPHTHSSKEQFFRGILAMLMSEDAYDLSQFVWDDAYLPRVTLAQWLDEANSNESVASEVAGTGADFELKQSVDSSSESVPPLLRDIYHHYQQKAGKYHFKQLQKELSELRVAQDYQFLRSRLLSDINVAELTASNYQQTLARLTEVLTVFASKVEAFRKQADEPTRANKTFAGFPTALTFPTALMEQLQEDPNIALQVHGDSVVASSVTGAVDQYLRSYKYCVNAIQDYLIGHWRSKKKKWNLPDISEAQLTKAADAINKCIQTQLATVNKRKWALLVSLSSDDEFIQQQADICAAKVKEICSAVVAASSVPPMASPLSASAQNSAHESERKQANEHAPAPAAVPKHHPQGVAASTSAVVSLAADEPSLASAVAELSSVAPHSAPAASAPPKWKQTVQASATQLMTQYKTESTVRNQRCYGFFYNQKLTQSKQAGAELLAKRIGTLANEAQDSHQFEKSFNAAIGYWSKQGGLLGKKLKQLRQEVRVALDSDSAEDTCCGGIFSLGLKK